MKKVEIYDQYADIFADNENNNQLVTSFERDFEDEDVLTRYTLVHSGSGIATTEGENLTQAQANELVENLYNASTTIGISYQNNSVDFERGYASLKIQLTDGNRLVRIIHSTDQ